MDKQEITLTSGNATTPLPPYTYQPSFTFPTEQSLREFVKRCVREELDELAREMRDKALQPGTWRKGVE